MIWGLLKAANGTAVASGEQAAPARIPRHVGIIMDGNGRWAVQRGLPRTAGHKMGVEALKAVVEAAPDLGVEVLTLYAFSTENWKRAKDEVDFLMALLVEYCRLETRRLHENGVRIKAIGRIDGLPPLQQQAIREAEALTAGNSRLLLNLAVNYGGRAELVDSVQAIAARVAAGQLKPEEINEALIGQHLYTQGMPDLDLVIRTAGEMRLSNFLLWQSHYSEIWISEVAWPDFKPEHLAQAVQEYGARERRFGGVPK